MRALHIILVEPEIHWNTGNVGRTSLALGAELHLVEPLGFTISDRELRRAGLDYWPRVKLRIWPSWAAVEQALPDLGTPFFFTGSATQTHWQPTYPDQVALVLGCESKGLAPEILQKYRDQTVRIPMLDPGLRSLNLSTAAALAGFEVMRQWGLRG